MKRRKAAAKRAIGLLESLGLGDQIDNYARNLPYGMQRKLEIARAIATNAKLIILDEPAAGMNPQESEELKEFILEAARYGADDPADRARHERCYEHFGQNLRNRPRQEDCGRSPG